MAFCGKCLMGTWNRCVEITTCSSKMPEEDKETKSQPTVSDDQKEKEEKLPTVDPILETIGEFGKWQFLLAVVLSLVIFPCTFHMFAPTFQGIHKEFWCARPAEFQYLSVEEWKHISGIFIRKPTGKIVYDPCHIREIPLPMHNITDSATTFDSSVSKKPCLSWEYDNSEFGETIISQWDLVCEKEQLANVAEMMLLLGVTIGGIVSGYFSDRVGRKKTVVASVILQVVLGLAIAFTPWFSLYLLLKALLGFVCVSMASSAFVLCMELIGGKWLTISGISFLIPQPLSYIIVSAIAYYIKDWRYIQIAITVPSIPFFTFWWILPESPRWLLTMGKFDEIIEVLEEGARVNKRTLPDNTHKLIKQSISKVETIEYTEAGCSDLFRTPMIRRISFVLYILWFTICLIYYGVVLNLSNLGGDIFFNSIISGVVEFPALAVSIIFLLKMGRRWPLFFTIIGSGVACLMTTFVPEDLHWLTITFAMIGKFCISSSNAIMPLYTAELFPTIVRNLGVGSTNIPAGIALMLVPYLWNLADLDPSLPMGVLGAFAIFGASVVFLLPDTGSLTDTIDDVK